SYARNRVTTTYYSQEQTGGAAPFGKTKSPVFVASQSAEFQHDSGVGVYTGNARMWQDDNFVKADRITLRREQTGGAAPFQNVKSPVFIASQNAEFRHDEGVGVYTGNARAWQDDNFVKADRIILRRETKRMEAEGNVQSALYNARRKDPNGARAVVPVFATSRTMFYDDTERLLHYESDVDIKQGTERITSEVADVYLAKDSYETERTVAQRNVVVTQPGKRGTGDWAQYVAADETVELRGVPARVVDAEQGTNEGRRMLVYLREDRVITDGGDSKQSSGRVRTTHKVKKQ
ncbi:MAG TPA: LptA/OstA family protein, partial [Pyrinomonadaceae bacterium]|nr:LptA/OstA family protein [Pyrinomonadaceae bacterium]